MVRLAMALHDPLTTESRSEQQESSCRGNHCDRDCQERKADCHGNERRDRGDCKNDCEENCKGSGCCGGEYNGGCYDNNCCKNSHEENDCDNDRGSGHRDDEICDNACKNNCHDNSCQEQCQSNDNEGGCHGNSCGKDVAKDERRTCNGRQLLAAAQCLCEQYYEKYGVELDGRCEVRQSWNNRKCSDYKNRSSFRRDNNVTHTSDKKNTHVELTPQQAVKKESASNRIKNKPTFCDRQYNVVTCANKCRTRKQDEQTTVSSQGHELQVNVKGTGECCKNRLSHKTNKLAASVGNSKPCHSMCKAGLRSWASIENCAGDNKRAESYCSAPGGQHRKRNNHTLEHLNLSGCFQITDVGLRYGLLTYFFVL